MFGVEPVAVANSERVTFLVFGGGASSFFVAMFLRRSCGCGVGFLNSEIKQSVRAPTQTKARRAPLFWLNVSQFCTSLSIQYQLSSGSNHVTPFYFFNLEV